MFTKQKTPKHVCLHERINRPCHSIEKDEIVTLLDGSTIIQKKLHSPEPEPFLDLGDADCYGIAYQQQRGIELQPVEGASRVSPMEAIEVSNTFIDTLHIPENEN